MPFEAQEQATEWAPVIGDPRVVHHWILYAVKGTSNNCGQLKRFVVGWAPGGTTQKTPPDIGLELPNSDERLLLEVHYNNPTMLTGIKDRTGVAMCTTKTPRPVEAGVITFGTTSIRIPGRGARPGDQGDLRRLQTRLFSQPVHLLSSFPHMHTRGVRFSTWINRAGGASVPVVEVKSWDFNHQAAYPHDHANLVINPGESLDHHLRLHQPDRPGDPLRREHRRRDVLQLRHGVPDLRRARPEQPAPAALLRVLTLRDHQRRSPQRGTRFVLAG